MLEAVVAQSIMCAAFSFYATKKNPPFFCFSPPFIQVYAKIIPTALVCTCKCGIIQACIADMSHIFIIFFFLPENRNVCVKQP